MSSSSTCLRRLTAKELRCFKSHPLITQSTPVVLRLGVCSAATFMRTRIMRCVLKTGIARQGPRNCLFLRVWAKKRWTTCEAEISVQSQEWMASKSATPSATSKILRSWSASQLMSQPCRCSSRSIHPLSLDVTEIY